MVSAQGTDWVDDFIHLPERQAELSSIRFHDLRHTFATHALTSGVAAKTLSTIIGHISSATTLDIYSHVTDTMQKQAAVKIDHQIGKTDAPRGAKEALR